MPDALGGQVAHDGEQLVDLGVGQRGGRFVEDQDPQPVRHGLGYLHHLLLADRQPTQASVGSMFIFSRRTAPRRAGSARACPGAGRRPWWTPCR